MVGVYVMGKAISAAALVRRMVSEDLWTDSGVGRGRSDLELVGPDSVVLADVDSETERRIGDAGEENDFDSEQDPLAIF